jgi:flagellar assembly protein FliH
MNMSDQFITADDEQGHRFLPVWELQSRDSVFKPSALAQLFSDRLAGDSDLLDDQNGPLDDASDNIPAGPSIDQQIADAYHQGVADGQKAVLDTAELDAIAASQLALAIENLKPQLSDTICISLMRAIKALLERSTGFHQPDEDILRQHCETLAKLVTKDMSAASLHLHPDDLAMLGDTEHGLPLHADASLRRGTLRLAHGDGWIEQGTQPLLDELQNLLDQIETGQ